MEQGKSKLSALKDIGQLLKKLLIIPVVIVGIVIVKNLVLSKMGPEQQEKQEIKTNVRVIKVSATDVLPRALAYGNAQPDITWNGVAEVKGKVIKIHKSLKKGALIKAKEVLIEIDPKEYEYTVAQIEAEIEKIKAELEELTIRKSNTEASLRIEKNGLKFAERELKRLKILKKKNTVVSQSTVDKQEQTVLNYSQSALSLENNLRLFPAEKRLLLAKQALSEAQLKSAQLNLARTTITLPFNARISEVNIENEQFASQGQILIRADSIKTAEISAQISLQKAQPLIPAEMSGNIIQLGIEDFVEKFGLSATVRLYVGKKAIEWEGKIVRTEESVDPRTRTLGFIVAVEDHYKNAIPGVKPPLFKNSFVEVELSGVQRKSCILIPRSALKKDMVWVVTKENRLETREVEADFFQSNFVVLKKWKEDPKTKKIIGLKEGESIVVSDLTYAIEGMLLNPISDQKLAKKLLEEATGTADLK